jgi:hypothetical protein
MFAKSLSGPSTPKGSAASLPPRLLRLLPAGATVAGWGSRPLKDRAFARRTNYLSYYEIFFDRHPLRLRRFGRRSSKRGTVPHGIHD